MSDINQVISLGIGTPADIEHFILFGLNAAPGTTTVIIRNITARLRSVEITSNDRSHELTSRTRSTDIESEER